MELLYIFSILFLLINFILYKKCDKKLCLWSLIIYSLGLLFCYNTFVVYLLHLIGVDGSLMLYSVINICVSLLLMFLEIFKHKGIQKFNYDKKKLVLILCLGIIVFLIGSYKLRGLSAVSFESADSAVHYKHALEFSESLSLLDKENSKDIVFKHFDRTLPISYINCGFLFNIFSGVKEYKLFFGYNVYFLVLSSMIFLITIYDLINKKQDKKYFHALLISLIYVLAFPLNNFIMGFCYLSISVIVLNLLYLTIINFKDSFDKNIVFKMIIILLITFGCFFSYYQFVPAIYLALGLYYINLCRNKSISFGKLLLYGSITLVLPFIVGFCYFLLPWIMESGVEGITKLIGLWGYSYDNITPMYLFFGLSFYILWDLYKRKKNKNKDEISYLRINLYIISSYLLLFFILYMVKVVDTYYFYKIFSIYWLCIILYFVDKIIKYKKIIYSLFFIICLLNVFAYFNGGNLFFRVLGKSNIYTWNTYTFIDNRVIINKEELELIDKSDEFVTDCVNNNRFLAIGNHEKMMWLYVISDRIPINAPAEGDYVLLYRYHIPSLDYYGDYYSNYNCAIYFYEGRNKDIDEDKYNILYENDAGVIVKRNNEK